MEENQNRNENQNQEISIGEGDTNKLPLLKKRSSLKLRFSMKDNSLFRSSLDSNSGLKRKISFNPNTDIGNEQKSEKSYSNSKTSFSSIVK
jgi:hypothetical protein